MGSAEQSAKKLSERLRGNNYILDKTMALFNGNMFYAIVDETGVIFNEAIQTFLFEFEKENSDKNCFVALDETIIVFPFPSDRVRIDFTFKKQTKSSSNFYLKNVFRGFIENKFLSEVLRVPKGRLEIFYLHYTTIKDSDDSEIIFHRFSIARDASDINKSISL